MFTSETPAQIEKKHGYRNWFSGNVNRLIEIPKGGHLFLTPAGFNDGNNREVVDSEPWLYKAQEIAQPVQQVLVDGSRFTQEDRNEWDRRHVSQCPWKIGEEYKAIYESNKKIKESYINVYGLWSAVISDKKFNPYASVYDGMRSPVAEKDEVLATIKRYNDLPHDGVAGFNILALRNGRGTGSLTGTVFQEFKKFPEIRKALATTKDHEWELIRDEHHTTTRQGHPMRGFILYKHENMTSAKRKRETTDKAWVTIRTNKGLYW